MDYKLRHAPDGYDPKGYRWFPDGTMQSKSNPGMADEDRLRAQLQVPKEWPVYSDGLRYIACDLPDDGIGGRIRHLLLGQEGGCVFALLPPDVDERFIYAFMRPYLLDRPERLSDFEPYVFDEVSKTMARGGQALVYDKLARLGDGQAFTDRNEGRTVAYGDQLLFRLDGNALDLFGFTHATSDCIAQDCLVLCSDLARGSGDGSILTAAEADDLIGSTSVIFARAYDGESWLVWRRT